MVGTVRHNLPAGATHPLITLAPLQANVVPACRHGLADAVAKPCGHASAVAHALVNVEFFYALEHAGALIRQQRNANGVGLTQHTQTAFGDIAVFQLSVMPDHQCHGRTRLQHTVRVALGIAADFCALGIRGTGIDTRQF